jgi:hypothetical protein
VKNVSLVLAAVLLSLLLLADSPLCLSQKKLPTFFGPDETDPQQALLVEALKLICPQGELLRDAHGIVAGCSHCPRQTTEWDADTLVWKLKRVFTGHFSSASEENIVLSGRGCEPHAANFGGTFVFTVRDSVVKLLHYNPALITERCHKFQAQNLPDMMVCTDDWGAQVTLWSFVYLVRFDRLGESNVSHIFEIIDESRQPCGIDFFDDSPTTVQKSEITALQIGKSKDGAPTLQITATLGEKNPTEEERKACQQGKPIPLTLKTYRLDFVFKDGTFQPSLETVSHLKLFPKPETRDGAFSPEH